MADTLFPPEDDLNPHRKRWSRRECARLEELGFLSGRYELIDGDILPHPGPEPFDRSAVRRVAKCVNALFHSAQIGFGGGVSVPGPRGDLNAPRPDITVTLRPAAAYIGGSPGPEDVLLAIEVADGTPRFDPDVKARLYAHAGVSEYWTVDVRHRWLHVYRDPSPDGYEDVCLYADTASVITFARPDAPVCVADLLPPLP